MPFNPAVDIPNLAGKVVFVTGGTAGIGRSTILALAVHNPAHIYFTGRNGEAGSGLVAELKTHAPRCPVTFIQCNLSSPRDDIRRALRDDFNASRLDIFIANAGIMATSDGLTAEGFEVQFGTNYVGHAIMLQLLRPLMIRTADSSHDGDVRVLMLSSFGHTMHPPGGIEFDKLKVPDAGTKWQRYGQSKLADILFAKAMAKRYPQITSVSVHPGLVKTNLLAGAEPSLVTRFYWILRFILPTSVYLTADKGACNTLWAATTLKANLQNGTYYEPVGKSGGKQTSHGGEAKICSDQRLADELWHWTEIELAGFKL